MAVTKAQQEKLYRYYTEPKMVTELTRKTLVLILAGGEGSRLKNLTAWRAKPAVPFGGKYRIVDFALSNCVNSGLRRIGVLTQYKSHSLIRHLQRAWSFMRAEIGEFVEILPAQQRTHKKEWYQGTADALFQNLDIVLRHHPEYVIVLGGDHIYTMDYSAMLLHHVERGADFTVGCIEVPREEASEFGVMSVDDDMRITKFTEKPANPEAVPGKPDTALASMGIYVFTTEYLFKILKEDAEIAGSSHDFGKDIIPANIHNARAMAYPFRSETGAPGYWRDVGTVYSYWKSNMELCAIDPELNLYDRDWPIWTYQPQSPPAKFIFDDDGRRGEAIDSLISAGCIISGARVKRSVIFFGCTVESYSLIKDCVILPKVSIGKNCRISRAIIDKASVIPDGTVIGEDLVEDAKRFHVTKEGIVLVTPEMLGQHLYR
ncbi:glucose-1-phosphate adenylyltransferase [Sulfuriferula nivalis]|uniref:Glucose-1-phosphate adenylyltransferase n=1 Tax=Sulfuriferula nivalis TaxID=2675298 RepID=A0A809RKE2_9PROT|nr:glucose-1-phosphate adenylyltransferase [Sulfuriferula nivalis]BBP01274.1 glucose-1-phosphate adenylyltransferase [Sulfuriferula nivalis]